METANSLTTNGAPPGWTLRTRTENLGDRSFVASATDPDGGFYAVQMWERDGMTMDDCIREVLAKAWRAYRREQP